MKLHIAIVVSVVTVSFSALAESNDKAVELPIECLELGAAIGPKHAPGSWETMLSFGACIQDARLFQLEPGADLALFVQHMNEALVPSMNIFAMVLDKGPDSAKLQAAYAIGQGQLALMTRARVSMTEPTRRDELERLLEPHAKLAYVLFAAIDRTAATQPSLLTDPTRRNMVRISRLSAASLRSRWAPDEQELVGAGGHKGPTTYTPEM